jgi:hypothetical protein
METDMRSVKVLIVACICCMALGALMGIPELLVCKLGLSLWWYLLWVPLLFVAYIVGNRIIND